MRYIGLWFMELRAAPTGLRVAFASWVYLVAGILICLYLAG